MISPQQRIRWLLLSGVALSVLVFITASRWFHVPAYPGFEGSILAQPSPVIAFAIVSVTVIVCVLLGTLVAGSVRFDAGLFCAAMGLIIMSLRSGAVGDLLRARSADPGGPTVFITLAAEIAMLYGVLGLAWSMLWLLHRQDYLQADRFRDGVEDTDDPPGIRIAALATQAAAMALFMLLLVQTDSKMQALWSVALASWGATVIAFLLYPVSPSPWLWSGPLFVGLAGYVLAYLSFSANDALWRTGQIRTALAPLARVLPIDYASAGTAGAILGYWMSRKWYRQRIADQGPQQDQAVETLPGGGDLS